MRFANTNSQSITDYVRGSISDDLELFLLPEQVHKVERYTEASLCQPIHYCVDNAGHSSR